MRIGAPIEVEVTPEGEFTKLIWERWLPLGQKTFLSTNKQSASHWTTRSKNAKAWRQAASNDAKQQNNPLPTGLDYATIDAWVYKTRAGRYDPANLYPCLKAIIDGYVDAGLTEDDNYKHIDGPHLHHGGFTKETPGILIRITWQNPNERPKTPQPHSTISKE